MLYFRDKCTGCGKCREVCPNDFSACTLCAKCADRCPTGARRICGEERDVSDVMRVIVKDVPFYGDDGGATFSGGECMLQIDFLEALLKACREKGIHTAVDTAGCVPWEYFERILPYTDLFLYDVQSMDEETHRRYVGVDNGLILENLTKLLHSGANVWVRTPVVAGVNDHPCEMQMLKQWLVVDRLDWII